MSSLSGAYLSLLMAIQENPLATVTELVDRVEGSKPTVIKRLSYLRKNKYFYVYALLNLHNMGFETVEIFLDTSNLRAVERLERMAKNHPYTSYRSRCFGSHNGMYLQFRIPYGARERIEEAIKVLEEEDVIVSHRFLPIGDEPTITTSMKIDGWNPESMSWKFDWKQWFEKDYDIIKPQRSKVTSGNVLEWITKNDMYILQQLMIGAKRSNTEMIRAIKKKGISFTPQTFGRRLRMVSDNCVQKYRVSFDPMAFDIITNILISGDGKRKYLGNLFSKMNTNPIPFESTMRVSDSSLYWFVRMPPSHLSSLLSNLHLNLSNMNVTIIDYSHSSLYSLWPEILDEESHSWRQDREFMVDQALK
ncbi:MAG: MarR family transcriptional regulator [Candidatus Thorarchaeota archaeon]|nr:MAG: MarR family transcriptional regulator [Candidatus Thorarchaeota archaeon]